MPENEKLFRFALDRIYVLERLVGELINQAGASDEQVQRWREHLANWPDVQNSLTEDTERLIETAHILTIHKRESR